MQDLFDSVTGGGLARSVRLRLLTDADHYHCLVQQAIPQARVSLWIATANLKGLMVEAPIGSAARARGRYVSFLDTLQSLLQRGVEVRVLHASVPSGPFRTELRSRKLLGLGLQMRLCPRVHWKMIAIDGAMLYLGSANLTGAGLGAKGEQRRNFELGIVTDDDVMLDLIQARFDSIWRGGQCGACKLRTLCKAPLDSPGAGLGPGQGSRMPK